MGSARVANKLYDNIYHYCIQRRKMRTCLHTLQIITGVLAFGVSAWLAAGFTAPVQAAPNAEEAPTYVATAPPLGMILREVAGNRAEVHILLPPGASPHTYEPKPSEVRTLAQATAFFYGGELLDGWAADLRSADKVAMCDLVPEELRLPLPVHGHHHGHDHAHGDEVEEDPHFWTSPRTVRSMLPPLVEALAQRDPAGANEYAANAQRFDAALGELDRELAGTLADVRGEHLLLFHPSFGYLMHDYGLELAAVVEPVPGQEPTPQFFAQLAELTERENLKAVFTEPQLPSAPAQAIARETGLPLFELDPLGGGAGRSTYAGLLRYNARTLAEALAQ